jgi:hypothetical protein
MDLLCDIGHVESHFNPSGDSGSVCARFSPNIAQKSFGTHPMVLLDDEVQVDTCFGVFGDSANLDAR